MPSLSIFQMNPEMFSEAHLLEATAPVQEEEGANQLDSRLIAGAATEPSLKCNTCGVGYGDCQEFGSVQETREHFKCDWHRHNLRRKLNGRPPIEEEEFAVVLEQAEEISSISGSDSSDSDTGIQPGAIKSHGPMISFLYEGKEFRMWRCSLLGDVKTVQTANFVPEVHKLRKMEKWAVVLAKGGHFAAAVFQREPLVKGQAPYSAKLHKTMHRYVVRAKAGGRQSTKDATGKFAKSAGARIRRHNEAALERDIQTTLGAWKTDLDSAEVIFYQVSSADKNALFGGKDPAFSLSDPRLRKISFSTRRPTFSEVNRVTGVLLSASASQSHLQEEASQNSPQEASTSDAQGREVGTSEVPAPVDRGPEERSINAVEESPLHKAARKNQSNRVWELLQQGDCPEILDENNCTPYQVATSNATRNMFRRYMAQEPEKWNYELAQIPGPLPEDLEQVVNKKKSKKKGRHRARKKQEKETRETEDQAVVDNDDQIQSDDEIERALADIAKETERMNKMRDARKKKSCRKVGSKDQPTQQKNDQDMARRRELLAAAAEERLNALKQASQKKTLW